MQTPVKEPQKAQKRPANNGQTRRQDPKQAQKRPQQKQEQKPQEQHRKSAQPQNPKQKQKHSLSAREKRGAQMLLAILFVAAVIYVVLVLIIAFFLWYSFGTLSNNTTLYALRVMESDGETRIASFSVEEANNRYGLYIPYSTLAPLCDFGIAGDGEQVTIYLPDAGGRIGSILCHRDSSLVEINGSSVRLSAPVLFEGDDYLLPVSLFESYLSGLDVSYDDDKQICSLTIPANPVFSLKLHRPEPATPCTAEQLALAEMATGGHGTSEPEPSEDSSEPDEQS